MSMDLTGIYNRNEYYTNHYFASIFEENASAAIKAWRDAAQGTERVLLTVTLVRLPERESKHLLSGGNKTL